MLTNYKYVPRNLTGAIMEANPIRKDFAAGDMLPDNEDQLRCPPASSIQSIMKPVKTKGVPVAVYEPTLDAPEFFGSEVTHDLGPSRKPATLLSPSVGATSSRTLWTRCTRGICLSASSATAASRG